MVDRQGTVLEAAKCPCPLPRGGGNRTPRRLCKVRLLCGGHLHEHLRPFWFLLTARQWSLRGAPSSLVSVGSPISPGTLGSALKTRQRVSAQAGHGGVALTQLALLLRFYGSWFRVALRRTGGPLSGWGRKLSRRWERHRRRDWFGAYRQRDQRA